MKDGLKDAMPLLLLGALALLVWALRQGARQQQVSNEETWELRRGTELGPGGWRPLEAITVHRNVKSS